MDNPLPDSDLQLVGGYRQIVGVPLSPYSILKIHNIKAGPYFSWFTSFARCFHQVGNFLSFFSFSFLSFRHGFGEGNSRTTIMLGDGTYW